MSWIQQDLVPSDSENSAQFGISVAIYGDTIIVGAPLKDAPIYDSGKAYIFTKVNGIWTQEDLVPSDPDDSAYFGNSVAIYGNTAIVGAPLKNAPDIDTGKVYIFNKVNGIWVEEQLVPSDPEDSAQFGNSVAIYSNTAIVGAIYKDAAGYNSGKVYIFSKVNGIWTQEAGLVPSDPESNAQFGNSVAIYGDTVIVGAPLKDAPGYNSGKVYIFSKVNGIWVEEQLVPSDPESNAQFGNSVAIYGNTIIVGASAHDTPIYDSGKVYIFNKVNGIWVEEQLVPSDPDDSAYFGNSVAIYGNTAIVGAIYKGVSGKTYIFSKVNGIWTQQDLVPSDPESNAQFGNSVAIYGDTIIVGAPLKDAAGYNSGKAYIFTLEQQQEQQTRKNITVNLNVTVDASGSVTILGYQPVAPSNIIYADVPLQVTSLYDVSDPANPVGLIEFWEPSDNLGAISCSLADSSGNPTAYVDACGNVYDLTGAYKDSARKLANDIEYVLCSGFDCSGVAPFDKYKVSGEWHPGHFGRLVLSYYADKLLGHASATSAITNDKDIMKAILSLDSNTSESYLVLTTVTGAGQTGINNRYNSYINKSSNTTDDPTSWSSLTGSSSDADLARRLVYKIIKKGLDTPVSTIIPNQTTATSTLASIVEQVLGQDASRSKDQDNNELLPNTRQLLKFYEGDTIYMNVIVKPPQVGLTNSPTTYPNINTLVSEQSFTIAMTLGPARV
jgi:hypothetical protein